MGRKPSGDGRDLGFDCQLSANHIALPAGARPFISYQTRAFRCPSGEPPALGQGGRQRAEGHTNGVSGMLGPSPAAAAGRRDGAVPAGSGVPAGIRAAADKQQHRARLQLRLHAEKFSLKERGGGAEITVFWISFSPVSSFLDSPITKAGKDPYACSPSRGPGWRSWGAGSAGGDPPLAPGLPQSPRRAQLSEYLSALTQLPPERPLVLERRVQRCLSGGEGRGLGLLSPRGQLGASARRVEGVSVTSSSPLAACERFCETCSSEHRGCWTCASGSWLHEGRCLAECPGGSFPGSRGRCRGERRVPMTFSKALEAPSRCCLLLLPRCLPVFLSLRSTSGAGNWVFLFPTGYSRSVCSLSLPACHESCSTCEGPLATHCTSCSFPLALRGGQCLRGCGEGFYQDHSVCEGKLCARSRFPSCCKPRCRYWLLSGCACSTQYQKQHVSPNTFFIHTPRS